MNAAALSAIHCAVFPNGWDEKAVAEMLAVEGTFSIFNLQFTIDNSELCVGFIIVRVAAEQADLITLAVLPEFRRQGIARKLLQDAMQKAANMGAAELFLEVSEANVPAQKLYESLGFTALNRRKGYYAEGDAIVMRATLIV